MTETAINESVTRSTPQGTQDLIETKAPGNLHHIVEVLPIMLTRYAVAEETANAPKIEAPFVEPTIDIQKGHAQYTQRLLSGGYVYVYDEAKAKKAREEADKKSSDYEKQEEANSAKNGEITPTERRINEKAWSVYEVDQNGDTRLIQDGGTSQAGTQAAGNLVSVGILLNLPMKPGKIWIAYSHTLWTDDVFDRHINSDYRERHMRQFDVGEWLAGNTNQPHVGTVNKAHALVAEFAENVQAHLFSFSQTNFPQKLFTFEFDDVAAQLGVETPKAINGSDNFVSDVFAKSKVAKTVEEMIKKSGKDVKIFDRVGLYSKIKKVLTLGKIDEEYKKYITNTQECPVIALNDPTSIVGDLAQLMVKRETLFHNQHAYTEYTSHLARNKYELVWKLETATLINGMKNSMADQEENALIDEEESTEASMSGSKATSGDTNVSFKSAVPIEKKNISIKLDKARIESWDKYKDSYHSGFQSLVEKESSLLSTETNKTISLLGKYTDKYEQGRTAESFLYGYNQAIKKFNDERIVPIDQAVVAWLEHQELKDYFECNHSTVDLRSGCDFALTLSNCLCNIQEKMGAYRLIEKWAQEPGCNNILAQAITLNNKEIQSKVTSFSTPLNIDIDSPLSVWGVPWNGIINEIANILNNSYPVQSTATVAIDMLLRQSFGAAMSALKSDRLSPFLTMVAALNKTAIVKIKVDSTLAESASVLVADLAKKGGASPDLVSKASERLLKSLRARRVDLSKIISQDVILLVHQNDLPEFNRTVAKIEELKSSVWLANMIEKRGGSVAKYSKDWLTIVRAQEKANYEALNRVAKITTNEALSANRLARWQLSIDNTTPAIKGVTKTTINLGLPTLNAVVQGFMAAYSYKSVRDATPENSLILTTRYVLGVASTIGSVIEAAGQAAQTSLGQKLSPSIISKNAKMIVSVGKRLGGAVGGVIAVCDFVDASRAWSAGQFGMMWLYIISGTAGLAAFAVFVISEVAFLTALVSESAFAALLGGPVAWVLLIISVGTAIAIMVLQDDPLQEWLGKTPFGVRNDKFKSYEEQTEALNKLQKA